MLNRVRSVRPAVRLIVVVLCGLVLLTLSTAYAVAAQVHLADSSNPAVAQPLEVTGALAGVVTSGTPLGSPLAGVTVECGAETTTTNASGVYSIPGLADGAYTATYTLEQYKTATATVVIVGTGTTTRDISLSISAGTLSGKVVSSGGAPTSPNPPHITCGGLEATADASGNYAIANIPPGTYVAHFTSYRYKEQTATVSISPDTTTTQNISLPFMNGSLKGTVTIASNGYALGGVTVSVAGQTAVTATSGSYQFGTGGTGGTIYPGSYTATFTKDGYVSQTATLTIKALDMTTKSVALAAVPVPVQPVAPVTPMIKMSPSGNKTYKRKKGVAKYSLSATFLNNSRQPLVRLKVYLQSRTSTKAKWGNTYPAYTDTRGRAVKTIKVKKRTTIYYRWFVYPQSPIVSVASRSLKFVIK